MSTDLAVIEAALEAATPGPWAVKEINLGAIGTQDNVLWPWVFATNPMPIPAAHGATTGPLIADLSRRHEEDPEDGIDYAHGGIASIETTDGNYPERDAADAHLIANAPAWLAELVERVKAAEAAIERVRRFGHDAKREYAHISGCGGDPECPACWAHDILRALDGDA